MTEPNRTRVTLTVAGMTCRDCERRVEQALAQAGAIAPRADWQRGLVTFFIEPGADLERFRAAVRAAGSPSHLYVPGDVTVSPGSRPREATGSSQSFDTDLLIIGGGSAGFAAAIEARQLGARVTMVEQGILGGTCVNIGCVPSKFFLRAAEVAHLAATAPYQGIRTHLDGIDLPALRSQQRSLIATLRQEKYEELVDFYGWELLRGTARFLDLETVAVGERRIRPRTVLLATGARPAIPPIPGLPDVPYLTSTTALELEQVPGSLIILGAGYVALELGQAFLRLGTAVTLLQRRPRLLPDLDERLATGLQERLAAEGMRFALGTTVQRVERTAGGVRVVALRAGREEIVEAEALLVATGRTPNTESLDLAVAGIATDERGAPLVDSTLRTTNPRVYAAGDVTRLPQFVYVAAAAGRLAARNALLGEERTLNLRAVPAVVFTDPQVATVGFSVVEAAAEGFSVVTGFAPAAAIARERVNLQDAGGVLVVADAETDRLLGVQAVASAAGELIDAATLAVASRLTLTDLREHLAPYLTSAEGLRLAALAVTQDVSHLSCCA